MSDLDIKKHIGETIDLEAMESWPATKHIFDRKSILAIQAAYHAKRPLLVRGEPGTGKSQLAHAAAQILGRAFVSEVVHARSECQDLQWHFDAIARLGEAQALSSAKTEDIHKQLEATKFLSPGALWWAFDWKSAKDQYNDCSQKRGPMPCEKMTEAGWVVLIDEIDKADVDLPNGLLETLGNGAFKVPYLQTSVKVPKGVPAPLVIITTNEERELPAAFLRRCLVLHMHLPEGDELQKWLVERGKVHFPECDDEVLLLAAEQLVADREVADNHGLSKPGQAEYLDLLRAVVGIGGGVKEQTEALKDIKEFVLCKHPQETA